MKAGGSAVKVERHNALLGIRGTRPHTKAMQKIFAEQTVIRTAIRNNHVALMFICDGVETDVFSVNLPSRCNDLYRKKSLKQI